jgi:hypothetical protein
MKNHDEKIGEAANYGKKPNFRTYEMTSTSAITKMEYGDRVWVRLDRGTVYGHEKRFSTFSGYRISPLVPNEHNYLKN